LALTTILRLFALHSHAHTFDTDIDTHRCRGTNINNNQSLQGLGKQKKIKTQRTQQGHAYENYGSEPGFEGVLELIIPLGTKEIKYERNPLI